MTKVALTFDAEFPDQSNWSRHEPPEDVAKICDALYQYSVPATFFVQGRWAQANPTALLRIHYGGFSIGSHGFYHAPYRLLTAAGAKQDLELAHEAIGKVAEPETFRYPFGIVYHKSTVEAAGYDVVGWDFAPGDWAVADWQVLDSRMQEAAGVVLLHTWPGPVSSHLKQIIVRMADAGVEFVKLEEI